MPKRILIADDDANLRKVLRYFIESRKACEVCGEAIDGEDAIEKAETLNPDLIILDYLMPKMNGIDVGAARRADNPVHRQEYSCARICRDIGRHTGGGAET
jgi:chemotaxis response regulator CheB